MVVSQEVNVVSMVLIIVITILLMCHSYCSGLQNIIGGTLRTDFAWNIAHIPLPA